MKNVWPSRVDGEVGRIEFPTYRVVQGERVRYDTARELVAPLGCWERYETRGFQELAFIRGVTEHSYHTTALWVNRIRHQDGATGATTLRVGAEREGRKVLDCRERTTTEMLRQAGFDETGQPRNASPLWTQDAAVMSAEQVKDVLDACDLTVDERTEVERNPGRYEQPTETVNISLMMWWSNSRNRTAPPERRNTTWSQGRRSAGGASMSTTRSSMFSIRSSLTASRDRASPRSYGWCWGICWPTRCEALGFSSLWMDRKPCTPGFYGHFHGSGILG